MNLTQLVQEITAAVERGDRQRALELVRQIQQRLVIETAERAAVERQVRALLAELDATQHEEFRIESIDLASTERSTGGEGSDERLYPVWFGTNRRPSADRKGFTGERHSSMTLGQVTVRVPNAHRFGETGSSFWSRLKRLDFRDDQLRLHGLKIQADSDFYASLQAAMHEEETPHALIFLHGFNVSFEEAAIRAAQLGCDLAVPDFDLDWLGHGYFAQADALLHDIYDLMRHDAVPGKRQRIVAANEDGAIFWKMR